MKAKRVALQPTWVVRRGAMYLALKQFGEVLVLVVDDKPYEWVDRPTIERLINGFGLQLSHFSEWQIEEA